MPNLEQMYEQFVEKFNHSMFIKVRDAMWLIKKGTCKRVDVTPTVKVYQVKDVIRIDVKI